MFSPADLLPHVYHVILGGIGGVGYILRQHLKAYHVRPVEYIARPLFGGIAAFTVNAALGFPDHNLAFCIFVGYSGVDAWDAVSSKYGNLPLASKHTKKPVAENASDVKADGEPTLEM